jgi:hypothetical protein
MEGQAEHRELSSIIERLVLESEGVVAIENRLTYLADDSTTHPHFPLPWTSRMSKADR